MKGFPLKAKSFWNIATIQKPKEGSINTQPHPPPHPLYHGGGMTNKQTGDGSGITDHYTIGIITVFSFAISFENVSSGLIAVKTPEAKFTIFYSTVIISEM